MLAGARSFILQRIATMCRSVKQPLGQLVCLLFVELTCINEYRWHLLGYGHLDRVGSGET